MCNNIYIIDDDLLNHFILNKLVDFNHLTNHHSNYTDARVALADLCKKRILPEAILLDINMPEMDGWQFLNEFIKIKKEAVKKIAVYIVSSSVDQRDKIHSQQFGVVKGFLTKPVSANDLRAALCSA